MVRTAFFIALFVAVISGSASGQDLESDDRSRFGVSFAFAPLWSTEDELIKKFAPSVQNFDLHGREIKLGVILRGREQSGDWGIYFSRKTIATTSTVDIAQGSVCFSSDCYENRDTYQLLTGSAFTGVEVQKFIPFVTVARKVQFGANLGLGYTVLSGQAKRTKLDHSIASSSSSSGSRVLSTTTVEDVDIKALFEGEGIPSGLPFLRVELASSIILPKGLKLRFASGWSHFGWQKFSVSMTQLMGAR